MKQDQFKNRYIVRLVSSICIALLNFVIQFLLPRAFSVTDYGYYSYDLNIFTSAVSIANLSMGSAMSSKFSKRNDEIGIIGFYIRFWIVMAFALNIVVVAIFRTNIAKSTFTGQTLFVVLLALESVLLTNLLSDDITIYDAMAISRYPSVMQVLLKVGVTVVVVAGYLLRRLTLVYFYISQIIVTATILIITLLAAFREQKRLYPQKKDYGTKAYCKEYYEYCSPLVLSTLYSQLIIMLMNWSLMRWSGVTEQAMFGAAWQLNTLVSFVFSPYCTLSRREFAVLMNNKEGMRHRYEQSLKIIMWLTSYFAIFIGINAKWILPIIYGEKYRNATLVTFLIMLYTIYQAWGQLSGAFLLATEKTKIHAIIGVAGQTIMLGCVFLFQIPNFIWSNSLGSNGIALTYLMPNILSVYFTLFVNSRILGMSFWRDISIQVLPILCCAAFSITLRIILDAVVQESGMLSLIIKTGVSGTFYTAMLCVLASAFPSLIGIKREQIFSLVKRKRE